MQANILSADPAHGVKVYGCRKGYEPPLVIQFTNFRNEGKHSRRALSALMVSERKVIPTGSRLLAKHNGTHLIRHQPESGMENRPLRLSYEIFFRMACQKEDAIGAVWRNAGNYLKGVRGKCILLP